MSHKILRFLVFSALFIVFCHIGTQNACGQAVQMQTKPSSDQWLSHQMYQPPPGKDRAVTEEVFDDIKQLYEDAKMEADKKKPQVGTKDSKSK